MFLTEWARRLWYLLDRRRIERELRQEMEAHREMMGEPASFGNTLRLREEARDVWGWQWLDDAAQDLRYGLRTLRLSPGFALTAFLILSFGIGVNLTFFEIVNAALLRPLPVKDPAGLVHFFRMSETSTSSGVPYAATQFLRNHNDVLSAILTEAGQDAAWEDDAADRVRTSYVSANWFTELGYGAALGRVFSEDAEEKPDAAPVVVLSHAFWQARLGADPDIVGKTVRVNGRPAVVIGVAPERFPGLRMGGWPQVWIPVDQIDYFNPGSQFKTIWIDNTDMYGRLRPGISPEAAKDGLRAAMAELVKERPDDFVKGTWLEPYSGSVRFQRPEDRREAWLLLLLVGGLTALVLGIACANLSNLVLARAVGRVREMSVRMALGASRWRVLRQLLTETLLLAALGTAGGVALSYGSAKTIGSLIDIRAYLDFTPDWRTMLAAMSAAAVTLLAVGFLPAWKMSRQDLTASMKDGGERTSGGLQRARLRQVLVAAQVAGSCLLLVVAGLMARGLQRMLRPDRGFEFKNVAVLEPRLGNYGIERAQARAFWSQVKSAVAAHPETASLALVNPPPLGNAVSETRFNDAPSLRVVTLEVEPDFFAAMKIPIVSGRGLEANDDHRTAVVISRRLALEIYGTLDVVGHGFPKTKPEQTIVGIAGDAPLIAYQARNVAEMYSPVHLEQFDRLTLVVRARTNPERLVGPMRDAARAADERVLAEARLMRTDFEEKLRGPRMASLLAGLTALLALLLACLGVFGVVSYGASLRVKEIGIRVALGAGNGAIVRVLLRQLTWPTVVGIFVGMAASMPVGRAFEGEPFYLNSHDTLAHAAAMLVLFAAGGIAALLPTLRALRADPLQSLRHE
jgi:predicted permease